MLLVIGRERTEKKKPVGIENRVRHVRIRPSSLPCAANGGKKKKKKGRERAGARAGGQAGATDPR